MAKDKNKANAAVVSTPTKESLEAELRALVAKYNKSAKYAEFKTMKELDKSIEDKLSEYNAQCETDCFKELAAAENPMVAAATMLSYQTLKVRDVSLEDGGSERRVEPAYRAIDPMRLHKSIEGGIGADKLWWSRVERLNTLLTAATAVELGAKNNGVELDVAKVKETAMMRDESKKLSMHMDKNPKSDKLLLNDLQETIDAMLGTGYTATPYMVAFVRKAHERKARKALTLTSATHKAMRIIMMDLCHQAITKAAFELEFKVAKQK